jgi:hypothetical protein
MALVSNEVLSSLLGNPQESRGYAAPTGPGYNRAGDKKTFLPKFSLHSTFFYVWDGFFGVVLYRFGPVRL